MITVIETTSSEIRDYEQTRYQEFMNYYLNTTLKVNDILKLMGLTGHHSVTKYIRKRLRNEGYDSLERVWSIKKGEWI